MRLATDVGARSWWITNALPLVGVALLFISAGCDGRPTAEYEPYADEDHRHSVDGPGTLETIREDALDEAASSLSGLTYSDLGEPYGCTDDCSGHEAGVAWAEENELRDPGDCGGRSQSFVEGCEAYTEAVQAQADEIEMRAY
jgi:hypothetical protein